MKNIAKLGLKIFEASTAIAFATAVVILTLLAGAGVKAAEPIVLAQLPVVPGTFITGDASYVPVPPPPVVSKVPTALSDASIAVAKAAEDTNQAAEAAGKALLSRWEILKAATVKEIDATAAKVEPEVMKAIEAAAASQVKEQETLTALLQAVEKAVK